MSHTPDRTVADELADALVRHGVDVVFGQSLPSRLFLSLERRGIRQLTYRTENAGGAMADGYARVSGKVGVIGAQNGPAAALLVPPLAEALKASSPVVALVQEVPAASRGRNAFQEFDHFGLFRACAKWVERLETPDRAEDLLDRAVGAATSGRPGPAVLLLPKDVLAMPSTGVARRARSLGFAPLDRPRPAGTAVAAAADLLCEARSPIVVVGGGVHQSGAAEALAALQSECALAVATTPMGKGAVDETHPLSMGVIGSAMGRGARSRFTRSLIEDADVVLLVGTRTNENGTDSWTLIPDGASVIHLDVDPAEIGRNHEALRLLGDARAGLEDLRAAMLARDLTARHANRDDVQASLAHSRALHATEVSRQTTDDLVPIRPERVMAELDRLHQADWVIVADASYSSIWMANYLTARSVGQRFLSPRGLAGLGWGLPLAIGAQLARPANRVVCVVGDGGFAHSWSELETLVREGLPVTIVLLRNDILGFQKHAENYQFDAHTTAVGIGAVDHRAIARACGATAVTLEDPQDLAAALAEATSGAEPTLLEVLVDANAYPPITAWDDHEDRVLGRSEVEV